MSDDVLWRDLLRIADLHRKAEAPAPFETAYADVARSLAICHRLGVDHPGVDMLKKDSFSKAELSDFFQKTWRLATLHLEERRVAQLEARGGVDLDAGDLDRLRANLLESRRMILAFAWLGEDQKRRHLDQLEAVGSELQRARDAFDVALDGVDDRGAAAMIEIGRPSPLKDLLTRLIAPIAGSRAQPSALPGPNARLAPPDGKK